MIYSCCRCGFASYDVNEFRIEDLSDALRAHEKGEAADLVCTDPRQCAIRKANNL